MLQTTIAQQNGQAWFGLVKAGSRVLDVRNVRYQDLLAVHLRLERFDPEATARCN